MFGKKPTIEFPLGLSQETCVAFYFNQSSIEEIDIRWEMDLVALQKYVRMLKATECRHLLYVTKSIWESRDLFLWDDMFINLNRMWAAAFMAYMCKDLVTVNNGLTAHYPAIKLAFFDVALRDALGMS